MKKILALAAFAAVSASATAVGVWSTGICAGLNTGCTAGSVLGNGVNDNNYQLISRADAGTTGNNSSVTETTGLPALYLASFQSTPATGASDWLTPTGFTGTTGLFDYRTTFDLTGFNAASLILDIVVAADNFAKVQINGSDLTTPLTTAGCNTFQAQGQPFCFQAFFGINHSITNANVVGGFLAGINTIDFIVTNNDASSPTGLRAQVAGNATLGAAATPEPGTLALLGLGLAGLGLVRRKTVTKK